MNPLRGNGCAYNSILSLILHYPYIALYSINYLDHEVQHTVQSNEGLPHSSLVHHTRCCFDVVNKQKQVTRVHQTRLQYVMNECVME